MEELRTLAKKENLDDVMSVLGKVLRPVPISQKEKTMLYLAAEEIFSNIANYAYKGKSGKVVVRIGLSKEPKGIKLIFMDWGIPYNPLKAKEPDITLCAEKRKIGGLGIFMAKKSMDNIEYQYRDGCNILTAWKALE